ncbi:DUF6350 family protein [Antrihabitans stalactiti]|uniref:Uncharacterized protein n=1 Tax=Antrihabitans stalactiti TaxID=2584121 RepID=A0A848KE42_9NOCA|nr:DUF6350 family protein [Antrihabitans stalactiti]NMN96559.1 hypothetical protein [Antrihabitans stalactiti]
MSALLESSTPPRTENPPRLTPDLGRRLLVVAFRPAVVTLTMVAALIVVTLVAANSDLTGTAGAISATWLALHQVPLTIGSTTIGILPLLPTFGLLWLVARASNHVVDENSSRRDVLYVVGAAVGGPLIVTIVCLAVIKDASSVISLSPPSTFAAILWVVAVHLVGATAGVAGKTWRHAVVAADIPSWAVAAALASRGALRRFAIGSAIVTGVSLLAAWSTVRDLLSTSDGFVGTLGIAVLSIAYLPNVVVGTAAVVSGGTFGIGAASVNLFGVIGGPVPGLPVMAAVPTGTAQVWWPVLLVVPVIVGVQLGRECAATSTDRFVAAKAAAGAAGIVGVGAAVLAFVSGGTLGSFGHIGAASLLFGALAFGWLVMIAPAAAFVTGRGRAHSDEPAEADEPSPVAVVADPPAIEGVVVEEAPAVTARPSDDIVDAEVVDLPKSDSEGAD